MEPTATAALIFLLCSQMQYAGALPVGNTLANYPHGASGNGKQGPFVKDTVAAKTRNANPPCQIVPDTDDATLVGVNTSPPPLIPVSETHQTVPPLPPAVNHPVRDTHQKPPPPPPNVFYQPIVPYYVLPPNPVSGGSYVYGHGAGFVQGGGQLLPHSPFSASGVLPAPQWFLNLQRDKHLRFPQSSGNPTVNRRGSVVAKRFDLKSSENSSDEDSDDD